MDFFVEDLMQVWDDDDDGILVLDGINHRCGSSKLAFMLRPSGCSKSALVQIVGDSERAIRGAIRIVDPNSSEAPSACLGERSVMMWQNLNLRSPDDETGCHTQG